VKEAARLVVTYLYENLVQPGHREPASLLICLFKTHPFRDLEPDDQESAQVLLEDPSINPLTPCLTFLAFAGLRPEWNDRRGTGAYRAIPIAGGQFGTRFPLSSRALAKIGMAKSRTSTSDDTGYDPAREPGPVFLESNAGASPFVRAETGFLPSFPVRAVLGFGGHLPSRSVFVAMLFSNVPIDAEQAARFTTIALSIQIGHPALRWAEDFRIIRRSIREDYL
jgi:hypothetical protein